MRRRLVCGPELVPESFCMSCVAVGCAGPAPERPRGFRAKLSPYAGYLKAVTPATYLEVEPRHPWHTPHSQGRVSSKGEGSWGRFQGGGKGSRAGGGGEAKKCQRGFVYLFYCSISRPLFLHLPGSPIVRLKPARGINPPPSFSPSEPVAPTPYRLASFSLPPGSGQPGGFKGFTWNPQPWNLYGRRRRGS